MEIIRNHSELSDFEQQSSPKTSIGFVPTMGALHDGHAALIKRALSENDKTIASIFVNPAQFNNAEDLDKYPRTEQADIALLSNLGCDAVFIPHADLIYPTPPQLKFDFGFLEAAMEGKNRPGHFNGVAIVVSKLFHFIQPTRAYFGEKDLQQLMIIQALVDSLSFPVDIVSCPTIREYDGLAMSSRNQRLSVKTRKIAPLLYKTLCDIRSELSVSSSHQLLMDQGAKTLSDAGFDVDYLELVHQKTLRETTRIAIGQELALCVAATIDGVRLIDNLRFRVDQNS